MPDLKKYEPKESGKSLVGSIKRHLLKGVPIPEHHQPGFAKIQRAYELLLNDRNNMTEAARIIADEFSTGQANAMRYVRIACELYGLAHSKTSDEARKQLLGEQLLAVYGKAVTNMDYGSAVRALAQYAKLFGLEQTEPKQAIPELPTILLPTSDPEALKTIYHE